MLKIGSMVDGKYKIEAIVGKGGMSTVYLARHETLGYYRAIKEVKRRDCPCYDTLKQGLIREISILKKLKHPNLPAIIDIIIEKDLLLIIMEYVEGKTLKEILETEESVPEKTVIQWGKQLCDVLLYLHTRVPPVIYRDLKPSNIILNPAGRLVLIDFGTAREYMQGTAGDTVCLGTRGYAAPEQYGGRGQSDVRTDIYCFGATLYHLVTGRSPEEPPYQIYPIRRWDKRFSPGLEAVLLKCTREDPGERYQNVWELKYDLNTLDEKEQRFIKRERRKLTLWLLFLCGMAISGSCFLRCRQLRRTELRQSALVSVKQAEKSVEEETAIKHYKTALQLMPAEPAIYDSLLKHYVRANDFQVEDAANLLNILEESGEESGGGSVLEQLRRKNAAAYCEFCYAVGIGFFYHMGNTTGKKESQAWFQDVCDTETDGFSTEKRERAQLYCAIAGYYQTFLENGADKSGEENGKDYEDFFLTLCELNQIALKEDSSDSEAAAACLVSREVAVEIGNFAAEFLDTGEITKEKLVEELDKIDGGEEKEGRVDLLALFKDSGEVENLRQLAKEARDKVQLADEQSRESG